LEQLFLDYQSILGHRIAQSETVRKSSDSKERLHR
jgi:hypothetical protein